jgi:hypothetical protein
MYVGDVRVETKDGSKHRFRGVWVSADSVGGWSFERSGVEETFALGEVATVKTRHVPRASANESRKTAIMVFEVVAIVGVLGMLTSGVVAVSRLSPNR